MSSTGGTSDDDNNLGTRHRFAVMTLHIMSGGNNNARERARVRTARPDNGAAVLGQTFAAHLPAKSMMLKTRNKAGTQRSPKSLPPRPGPGSGAHGGDVAGLRALQMELVTAGNTARVRAKVTNTDRR